MNNEPQSFKGTWLRFSLRQLFWTIGLAAIVLGFWQSGMREHPASSVNALAFSNDGKSLAIGIFDWLTPRSAGGSVPQTEMHQTVKLFDVASGNGSTLDRETGSREFVPGPLATVKSWLGFDARDGSLAMSCLNGTVKVWSAASREPRLTLRAPSDELAPVAISPGGELLAAGKGDAVELWNTATAKLALSFAVRWKPNALCFSPDGTVLAVGMLDRVLLWDVPRATVSATLQWSRTTGRLLPASESSSAGLSYSAAISPDGLLLASGGQNWLKVFDLKTGEDKRSFELPWATSLAFAPEGGRIVAGGPGGVRLVDLASGSWQPICAGTRDVQSLAISRDGRRLATGDNQGMVVLWNTSTWRPEWSAFAGERAPSVPWLIPLAALAALLAAWATIGQKRRTTADLTARQAELASA